MYVVDKLIVLSFITKTIRLRDLLLNMLHKLVWLVVRWLWLWWLAVRWLSW